MDILLSGILFTVKPKRFYLNGEYIMSASLLGIDIGTSACKAAIFDEKGIVFANESAEYSVLRRHFGWAEQNAEDWWNAVCKALSNLREKGFDFAQIEAIGVDGQGWSPVALDKNGNVLANTPLWMDIRAQKICDELECRIGKDAIFNISGNPVKPGYTTPKVIWLKQNMPERWKKVSAVLQSNGYIAYRLTGELTQDLSQAYGWHCFNMKKGVWDKELCKEFGLNHDILPELFESHKIIGYVTEDAASQTGLKKGTPVVAGGLDAACGTLGAGVLNDGQTQEQGGQAGGMSICTADYRSDPRLILSFHVAPGRWLLQGGTTGGGGVMRWLAEELGEYEKSQNLSVMKALDEKAQKVSPGSDGVIFLPYMAGERSPIWNPYAKGVFYGLDYGKTKGHIIRASLEGVAYSLRHNLETARSAGANVEKLYSMGGAANSLLWTQIKADITGLPIFVPSSDTATTWGAAMLAGVGCGMFSSFENAVKNTVAIQRTHMPNKNVTDIYSEGYRRYIEIYELLKKLMSDSERSI